MIKYYNKKGKEINFYKWVKLLEGDYMIIKQDVLPNKKFVSTIWIGISSSYNASNRQIFETAVYPKKKEKMDAEDMELYSTLREAKAGHEKMVKKHS